MDFYALDSLSNWLARPTRLDFQTKLILLIIFIIPVLKESTESIDSDIEMLRNLQSEKKKNLSLQCVLGCFLDCFLDESFPQCCKTESLNKEAWRPIHRRG